MTDLEILTFVITFVTLKQFTMKNLFIVLLLILSNVVSAQKVEVSLSQFQSFYHEKNVETNVAIKENSVTYTEAYYTDTKLIFDLDKKTLTKMSQGKTETYPIREIRRNSDVLEVDVLYSKTLLVNYFISKIENTDKDIILCRWIENDKVFGWADKDIKIKKGS